MFDLFEKDRLGGDPKSEHLGEGMVFQFRQGGPDPG